MRRLALETRVLDGHTIGGWRVRSQAEYTPTSTEKAGKTAGKTFQRGGRSASFFGVLFLVPSPPALEVTGDFD
jgi:hypothetical protein